jgi:sugar phosphate isomerase/epimerase
MGWLRSELTYCTNVHPANNQAQVMDIVAGPLARVRQMRDLPAMTGGLWFSRNTARELLQQRNLQRFVEGLKQNAITLLTLNGFPAIDFHAPRIKETVYRPDWADAARLEYTLDLAQILCTLLQPGTGEGTISTVPLGFAPDWNRHRQAQALLALCRVAEGLHRIHQESGRRIRLCLEMEPGCALQDTDSLIAFFTRDLAECARQQGLAPHKIDDHLGICFDVCHQAVMFEDTYEAMRRIVDADIHIGKIQLSSALELADPEDDEARSALADFAEAKYLHQSCCRDRQGRLHSVLDLDQAFDALPATAPWRVHFHVPIQAESLISDGLGTTQREIGRTLDFLADHPGLHPHLEVETYTWGVLPEAIRPAGDRIVDGLSAELQWLEQQMRQRNLLLDQAE